MLLGQLEFVVYIFKGIWEGLILHSSRKSRQDKPSIVNSALEFEVGIYAFMVLAGSEGDKGVGHCSVKSPPWNVLCLEKIFKSPCAGKSSGSESR